MESLTVLELPQLACRSQLDMGVAADAPSSAGIAEGNRREDPVPQIRFGERTKARHGLALRQRDGLRGSQVGRVNDAPPAIHSGITEQPFDRSQAAEREAIVDLPELLGGMDMNRSVIMAAEELGEMLEGNSPQRMRSDSYPAP